VLHWERLLPVATWDDLALPDAVMRQLRSVAEPARETEPGITLFAGRSGTGKTLAAEALANQLGRDLYRIDLSAVVSRYIGETEKQLGRLLDDAESTGAILYFDEEYALFGKRTGVRDSHDRYANLDIQYLLQRLESCRGLIILATNRKSALRQAVTRRLRRVIDFPPPGRTRRGGIRS
jgi:SpoVK/Ycf46/Vps4 family AAA+-type ATPase